MSTEIAKLGPEARHHLFIQLASFPSHYLVIVITDNEYRYALITTHVLSDSIYANMILEDIAWLDFARIHGEDVVIRSAARVTNPRGMENEPSLGHDALVGDGHKNGQVTTIHDANVLFTDISEGSTWMHRPCVNCTVTAGMPIFLLLISLFIVF